jgi:hypothetical protein
MKINKNRLQVLVGGVAIGGGAPTVVQSMTNTDTADRKSTVDQVNELWKAGSELVRITVNNEEGAVFMDGGINATTDLITNWFKERIDAIDPDDIQKDSKSILQELLQAKKIALPEYSVVAIEGEAHRQNFKISCSILKLGLSIEGQGSSRKIAEQSAAEEVLKNLKKNPKL